MARRLRTREEEFIREAAMDGAWVGTNAGWRPMDQGWQAHDPPHGWGAGTSQAPPSQAEPASALSMRNPPEITRRTGLPVSESRESGVSFIDCFTSKRRTGSSGPEGMVSYW